GELAASRGERCNGQDGWDSGYVSHFGILLGRSPGGARRGVIRGVGQRIERGRLKRVRVKRVRLKRVRLKRVRLKRVRFERRRVVGRLAVAERNVDVGFLGGRRARTPVLLALQLAL